MKMENHYSGMTVIVTRLLMYKPVKSSKGIDNMTTEHNCIQEPTITQLQVHQDYETQRIDELRTKIDKMDKKIDKVLEGFNELKLQSNKDDNQLELRLKAIETELALQKHKSLENHNRLTQIVAIVGVGLTIITILINVYFKMI